MNIWYKYKDNKPEKIDIYPKCEIDYMIREYRIAFKADQKNIKVWAGLRKDEP